MPSPTIGDQVSFTKFVTLAAVSTFTLGLSVAPSTAATHNAQHTTGTGATPAVARYGAGWLAREIASNNGYLAPFGSPDVSDTAYAVLGLHAAGVGRTPARQAMTFLEANLGAPLRNDDGTDNPGLLGYVIMAAVASGDDPYHFGGRSAVNNLPKRLLATKRTSGPDSGLFGSEDPTYDGAFRQGTALAALKAAGIKASTLVRPLAWLTAQQCADGLWTSYRSKATPCAAADPNSFSGPDTNSTGMAVQGLAAFGRYPRETKTVAALDAIRTSDGGFPYIAAAGQASDPDSTALTIQALLASGASVGRAYQALAGFQLGCSAASADRGAFFYPGDRSPNVLATVQAVPAAAGMTLPLGRSTLSDAHPAPTCSSASDTAVSSARAGTAGACKGTSGVTVTVDFTAFSGVEQTRCAAGAQTSGITALQHAGFTVAGTKQFGLAFVCRIQGLPSTAQQSCNSTPPANAYWAYYHASATATTWSYATSGASSYKPPVGSIDAWAFGNGAKPTKTPAQVRASKS